MNTQTTSPFTKDTYIFDLDGTIANIDARRKLCALPNGKIDFKKFFDPQNIDLDLPNDPVIYTLQLLHKAGHNIIIFSGRSKATKDATMKWLKQYDVPYHVLKMRPTCWERAENTRLIFCVRRSPCSLDSPVKSLNKGV